MAARPFRSAAVVRCAVALVVALAVSACGDGTVEPQDPASSEPASTAPGPTSDIAGSANWPAVADMEWDRGALLPDPDEDYPAAPDRGRTLEGLVVDEAGEPVAGATVAAERIAAYLVGGRTPRLHVSTESRADGTFRVGPLPEPWESRGLLAVRAPGRATIRIVGGATRPRDPSVGGAPDDADDEPLSVTLPEGREVRGQILDQDGRAPLEPVTFWVLGPGDFSDFVTTSATGGFVFRAPAGDLRIQTLAGAHAPTKLVVRDTTDDLPALILRVERAGDLEGRVLDVPTGRPVPHAVLRAFYGQVRLIEADAEGRFILPHYWQEFVQARRPGWAERHFPVTPAIGGAAGEPVTIGLQRGLVVAGRVVDAAGEPVMRARLRILRQDRWGGSVDLLGPRTGDDGSFVFVGAPRPDEAAGYRIFVHAPGYEWGCSPIVDQALVGGAERVDDVTVVLPRPIPVTGLVVDEQERPRSATVRASWFAEPEFGMAARTLQTTRWTTTDDEGRFTLDVPQATRCRFDVEGRGIQPTIIGLRTPMEPGAVAGEPDVTLRVFRGAVIEGVVVDREGHPVTRGAVRVDPAAGSPVDTSVDTRIHPDGTFEAAGLAPGEYDVSVVVHPEFLQWVQRGVAAGGPPLDVRLRRPGAVHGTIARPDDASVTTRIDVVLEAVDDPFPLEERFVETVMRQDGAFRFARVTPGRWRLMAWGGGLIARPREVVVPDGGTVDHAPLLLEPGAVVAGTLRTAAGPVAGATVEIFRSREDGRPRVVGRTRTDSEGEWRIEGLMPGPIVVSVLEPGHPHLEVGLEAEPGVGRRADLRLAPGGAVDVLVESDGGDPVAEARVTFLGGDGSVMFWQRESKAPPPLVTGPDGRLACIGLPAGSRVVRVVAPDGREGEAEVRVEDGGRSTVRVVVSTR